MMRHSFFHRIREINIPNLGEPNTALFFSEYLFHIKDHYLESGSARVTSHQQSILFPGYRKQPEKLQSTEVKPHVPKAPDWKGTFRKYDYGPKGNVKLYGQTDPPHYNLSAVTAPSAFFSAPLDGMISLEDVYEAILNLPNTIYLYRIPFYRFNHIHYLFGRNASELVYEPTYQLIKKIDSGVIPPQVEVPSDYR